MSARWLPRSGSERRFAPPELADLFGPRRHESALMEIRGVLETSVYATDLDAAERFYASVLGLERIARAAGRHVFFSSNRGDYEDRGLSPFQPFGEGGATMQYYPVPEEILEDPEALRGWVDKAIAVAARKKIGRNRRAKWSRKSGSRGEG